jgi:hypothetical protein
MMTTDYDDYGYYGNNGKSSASSPVTIASPSESPSASGIYEHAVITIRHPSSCPVMWRYRVVRCCRSKRG